MVLGKKVAIFDWKWGRNSPLEIGRKGPVTLTIDRYFQVEKQR